MKTNIIFVFHPGSFTAMLFLRPSVPAAALLGVLLSVPGPASAEETFTIAFRDHRIVPEELQVPAGRKFILIVDNQDATAEEFESHSLKREKVVSGKSKASVRIGPLKPGTYDMFGEYHEATAKGRIVAK